MKAENRRSSILELASSFNPKGIASYSPGLRGTSYPGLTKRKGTNPKRVVASSKCGGCHNPVGVEILVMRSQGSSFLATLGFGPESRWDSGDGIRETIPG